MHGAVVSSWFVVFLGHFIFCLSQSALEDEVIQDYLQLESILRTTSPGTTLRFRLLDGVPPRNQNTPEKKEEPHMSGRVCTAYTSGTLVPRMFKTNILPQHYTKNLTFLKKIETLVGRVAAMAGSKRCHI